jgi:hypothetical protein
MYFETYSLLLDVSTLLVCKTTDQQHFCSVLASLTVERQAFFADRGSRSGPPNMLHKTESALSHEMVPNKESIYVPKAIFSQGSAYYQR